MQVSLLNNFSFRSTALYRRMHEYDGETDHATVASVAIAGFADASTYAAKRRTPIVSIDIWLCLTDHSPF